MGTRGASTGSGVEVVVAVGDEEHGVVGRNAHRVGEDPGGEATAAPTPTLSLTKFIMIPVGKRP